MFKFPRLFKSTVTITRNELTEEQQAEIEKEVVEENAPIWGKLNNEMEVTDKISNGDFDGLQVTDKIINGEYED